MSQAQPVSFQLLDEPWIPCETSAGQRIELGLRQVLERAHELSAVHDESPLVTAVLHRLLLVVLDRALSPTTREDWLRLWSAETLPAAPIEDYLASWQHRFDLFDEKRPFMQVARLEAMMTAERGKPPERQPMSEIVMETSNFGGQVHLFAPKPADDADAGCTPAEAAKALLVFQGYSGGGRINNETASWKSGLTRAVAVILIRARTLRETLLLNLVWRSKRAVDDVPPWERARDIARVDRPPAGPSDQMLWPCRRAQLVPMTHHGVVAVAEAVTGAGEKFEQDVFDPLAAYVVRDPKRGPLGVRFDTDRSLWRDSAVLFELSGDAGRRPEAVQQLAELIAEQELPPLQQLSTQMLGMATDQRKVHLWRDERLPLPNRILVDKNRVEPLRPALALAEAVGTDFERKVLYVLCERILSPGEREAHRDDIGRLRDSLAAGPAYWAALGLAFPEWLSLLGSIDDPDDALPAWRDTVRAAVRQAFDLACRRVGTGARAIQAVAQAEKTFGKLLYQHGLLPPKSAAPATQTLDTGVPS